MFLQDMLEEEVYMSLPPGHAQENNTNLVCKLRKSIYEFKQSPWT
jgi:Reverse transcriptase (RNA-dependent DNA polymerase)